MNVLSQLRIEVGEASPDYVALARARLSVWSKPHERGLADELEGIRASIRVLLAALDRSDRITRFIASEGAVERVALTMFKADYHWRKSNDVAFPPEDEFSLPDDDEGLDKAFRLFVGVKEGWTAAALAVLDLLAGEGLGE